MTNPGYNVKVTFLYVNGNNKKKKILGTRCLFGVPNSSTTIAEFIKNNYSDIQDIFIQHSLILYFHPRFIIPSRVICNDVNHGSDSDTEDITDVNYDKDTRIAMSYLLQNYDEIYLTYRVDVMMDSLERSPKYKQVWKVHQNIQKNTFKAGTFTTSEQEHETKECFFTTTEGQDSDSSD